MPDPDESGADAELPLPPRPPAEVLVPPLRPSELRRELQRLEGVRDSALRHLGGEVVEMARQGALSPARLADGAAAVRSRQDQIDALSSALGGKTHSPTAPENTRRATLLAALLAVAILGAVAGAWIERRHDDTATATPLTVPTVITEIVTTTAPATAVATRVRSAAPSVRGGRAAARRR